MEGTHWICEALQVHGSHGKVAVERTGREVDVISSCADKLTPPVSYIGRLATGTPTPYLCRLQSSLLSSPLQISGQITAGGMFLIGQHVSTVRRPLDPCRLVSEQAPKLDLSCRSLPVAFARSKMVADFEEVTTLAFFGMSVE
jgi:hypothetical protein